MPDSFNVADLLARSADRHPDGLAVAMPSGPRGAGREYEQTTFEQLDQQSDQLAAGMLQAGIQPGMRVVLLVPFSTNFIRWVFAVLKSGAVMVLVDPGMGRRNMIRCLQNVDPQGFIAISRGQAIRSLLRWKFPHASHNITVGRRWFWGGVTERQITAQVEEPFESFTAAADDPAAVIFTTGSTGPPKGVAYQHGNFYQQVMQIQQRYHIQPGDIDLPAFPLFGLFNAAMGVTSVIPVMDPSRPAEVDPREIIEPIQQWQVKQSFGSPALWDVVGRYCEEKKETLPSLQRVLSSGAPVPPRVLRSMTAVIGPGGEMYTPYGATEALPVASISASEVLQQTASLSEQGKGTCVGRRFDGIEWKVIRICDEVIKSMEDAEPLPAGEIGELLVRGPVVTARYVNLPVQTNLHKIEDGETFWHRMGDVGYFDQQQRFWFCGRKSQRVTTGGTTLYTVPCEAVLNRHPSVFRSALVGVGPGRAERAVMIVELWPNKRCKGRAEQRELCRELLAWVQADPLTSLVERVLVHPALPVDIRHNAKIFREKLAVWAAGQM
ncbi:MAG: fatty acid CoA ligase family protein [Planctomycetota bacterium]|nr:fatty acid CoA ligase family protein [Planctomycetota bacterium]MEE2990759.1 fatty acid CoA ligase family protein [Planctomycetota bacterium]